MTSIVGILCKDGVVIGTDSAATFGDGQIRTIEQPVEKLEVISGRVIVAGTGYIGLGQRFCEVMKNACDNHVFSLTYKGVPKQPKPPYTDLGVASELCRLALDDFVLTKVTQGQYGALVAYSFNKKPCLCEFEVQHFQPELKTDQLWFSSMGCGEPITDPFLALMREVYGWTDGVLPTVQEAVFIATWTLDNVVKVNTGGINGPVKIAILESIDGQYSARILANDELQEHREHIEDAKLALRDLRKQYQVADSAKDIPQPA